MVETSTREDVRVGQFNRVYFIIRSIRKNMDSFMSQVHSYTDMIGAEFDGNIFCIRWITGI